MAGFGKINKDQLLKTITERKSRKPMLEYKLQLAVRNGETTKVSELIEAGVNPTSGMFDAVEINNEIMVRLLIDAGAEVNTFDSRYHRGPTLLFKAVQNKNEPMVKLLIDAGADVNNNYGDQTPLSIAVKNNEAMVKLLVDAGADVNAIDDALFYLVQNKNERMVRLLIDAGADVNTTSKGLFYSVLNKDESMARLLIDAGADVDRARYGCQTPLFYAVQHNNEPMVQLLIDAGANVNIIEKFGFNNHGLTAVFYAAFQNKNDSMVQLLIGAGADVNIVDDNHWFRPRTVLDHYVQNNNEDMVRFLIGSGADVNIVGDKLNGKTVLFDAIEKNKINLVHVLVGNNGAVNFPDKHGKTPLFASVEISDNESVVSALIHAGAEVNITDNEGKTALFHAVQQSNNESVVSALIDAGAEVNITDNEGKTALFYAVQQSNNESVVHALIDAGADVNVTDKNGQTPLFQALQFADSVHVVRRLIDAEANVNITDNFGNAPLSWSVVSRREIDLAVCETLIQAGADVNTVSMTRKTALFYAVERGNPSLISTLIDAGADVNSTTQAGETALSKAAKFGDFSTVCLLIKAGADLQIKSSSGRTALFCSLPSCYKGDFRSFDALTEAGADINTQDNEGNTPLFDAVSLNSGFDFTFAQRLIDIGADVNKTDNEGQTVLFSLISKSWYCDIKHMFDGLISAGLDVNKANNFGQTVLHNVAMGENVELTQRLIETGAHSNISDCKGQTPLFYAVLSLHMHMLNEGETEIFMFGSELATSAKMKVVRALVEDGNANVNARDTLGRTPLFYAIGKSLCMSTYLIEHGANLSIRDNCGVNVLSLFIESCMVSNEVHVNVYPLLPRDMNKMLDLLLQHGITRNAVFEAIINVVFCKTLLVASYISVPSKKNEIKSLFNILKVAGDYITETQNTNKKRIEDILTMVQDESRDFQKFYEFLVPDILLHLIELGANPNSADAFGNTALHYATCLPLYGLSRVTVLKICHQLENAGVLFNIRNQRRETPPLFCLFRFNHPLLFWNDNGVSKLRILRDVYLFLLEHHGSCEDIIVSRGNSIFHVVLGFFSDIFNNFHGLFEELDEQKREERERENEEKEEKELRKEQEQESQKGQEKQQEEVRRVLLSFLDTKLYVGKDTINMRNDDLDSPLHCWARLNSEISNIEVGTSTLRIILNHLLEYGANVNITNEEGQTPLHVCSSWAAVTMLLDAGADPCVSDSLGRQPLLVVAEYVQQLQHVLIERNRLYFDLLLEPHEFWRGAIQRGLDPWAVDKRGESVLSVLIKSDQFVLSKALVEVARDDNHLQSESIATTLLNTICKDKSTHAHWKSNLAEIILMSVGGSVVMGNERETSLLHHCCRNIVEPFSGYYVTEEKAKDKEVYWTIAKLLLSYGADCTIADSSGKSCLDIAKTKPALKNLLTKPQDIKEVPLLIPWTSISDTFEDKLARVARRKESKHLEPYWYHKDHLASGSFGAVFAGINEKDGREVAIKRIEKIRMVRPEDKREITNLTALADCEQVVRYLSFIEDEHFSYVVLELMEGTLDDYLDSPYFDKNKGVELCGNVINGLRYLHSQQILHRDLKPSNILYKCHPKLCLKIADFGLSRRIDSACTTVYGTNVGTRCWIASEVLKSKKAGEQHSKVSDVFSCGLVLHYMLSVKKHPFATADLANKSEEEINHATEDNILNGKMEGWDDSLCPEAAHLIKAMLDGDENKRPSADKATKHTLFWKEKEKQDFLIAVGNQPEFECPRAKRTPPLTAVETDFETSFGTIVKYVSWNDPGYLHMPAIYTEMMMKRKLPYDPFSTVELVRFIRNAIAHVSGSSRPPPRKKLLLEDFIFLEYFPDLVMEVYKAVTTHGWDQTREEIKYALT